jgi:hypothetical protein
MGSVFNKNGNLMGLDLLYNVVQTGLKMKIWGTRDRVATQKSDTKDLQSWDLN